MPTFNNPDIASFYQGAGGPYSNRSSRALAVQMAHTGGRLRRRIGLGSVSSASVTSSPSSTNTGIPTAGGSLQSTANSIASIGASAAALVKAGLQAEAAQNAINAQKNLTTALTPGVITIILGVIIYAVVVKK
jgi:hypothetical protein